jgi:serine/threonine-protein kinase
MGAVYEGRNQIGKRIAVKLLLEPELLRNLDLIARFFREAQAAAAVESSHVVDVYDTGVDEDTGFPFIIMAFLNGEDLAHLVRRLGPLNPIAAVRIAAQAAAGLAKAHDAGIVHRDIKPANLFLAKDEGESVVKLLDFGIAKLSADGGLAGVSSDLVTQSGALLGTPLYMSPEQAQGLKTIDARTDIWSLGMCLYQALAGRSPFSDIDAVGQLIVSIVTHEVPPLATHAPWVRPELAAVVHRALERDVEKRIASARDFMAALSPFLNGALAVTPEVLIGARDALDATLVPGISFPPSPPVGALLSPLATTPLPTPATTAGVSSASEPPNAALRKRSSPGKRIAMGVAGLVAAVAAAFALARSGGSTSADRSNAATSGSFAPASPSVATTSPAPALVADERKVGVLTLKIPKGYTVKVDGFGPGSPESRGAARTLEDGSLELRGEFQTKFLVAVFAEDGTRVMVQDVYLYDNKLDPEKIDTDVGAVKVEKPRRRATGVAPATASSPSAAAPSPSASDLPARF